MASADNFIDVSLVGLSKKKRQVFVAYSYRHYKDKRDYRNPYAKIGKAFDVEFVFADEQITSLHVLQKISNMIRESAFGIYDITSWNPNVTLELGLALGMGERVFISYNPNETDLSDVPSDLKGVDRLQYTSFSSLGDELERLLSQVLPPSKDHKAESYMDELRERVVETVNASPGITVTTIATAVGVSVELAQLAIRREYDVRLTSSGVRKGTKYFPKA